MKLNCGPSQFERALARHTRLKAWHPWFAWFPVRVGSRDCRWLQTVERRGTFYSSWCECWWEWEYREAQHD